MVDILEESKKNINQFYQNQKDTMTDLYRAQYYVEMIEKNIERLNYYLEEHRKIDPSKQQDYARNLNNISIQTNILKVTHQAMDDEFDNLKRRGEIQGKISGRILHLKKDLKSVLDRVTKEIHS